jgi:hypothetical protein
LIFLKKRRVSKLHKPSAAGAALCAIYIDRSGGEKILAFLHVIQHYPLKKDYLTG